MAEPEPLPRELHELTRKSIIERLFFFSTVVGGQLNHLSECKHRAYECLAFDPEELVAVATWRRSKPASEIVGHHDVTGALDVMAEIRNDLEPEARFSSSTRIRGLASECVSGSAATIGSYSPRTRRRSRRKPSDCVGSSPPPSCSHVEYSLY